MHMSTHRSHKIVCHNQTLITRYSKIGLFSNQGQLSIPGSQENVLQKPCFKRLMAFNLREGTLQRLSHLYFCAVGRSAVVRKDIQLGLA